MIISDAGSTKAGIVAAARRALKEKTIRFVGAHPMAGSHKSGASAADINLFEKRLLYFYSVSFDERRHDSRNEESLYLVCMLALSRLMPKSMTGSPARLVIFRISSLLVLWIEPLPIFNSTK